MRQGRLLFALVLLALALPSAAADSLPVLNCKRAVGQRPVELARAGRRDVHPQHRGRQQPRVREHRPGRVCNRHGDAPAGLVDRRSRWTIRREPQVPPDRVARAPRQRTGDAHGDNSAGPAVCRESGLGRVRSFAKVAFREAHFRMSTPMRSPGKPDLLEPTCTPAASQTRAQA